MWFSPKNDDSLRTTAACLGILGLTTILLVVGQSCGRLNAPERSWTLGRDLSVKITQYGGLNVRVARGNVQLVRIDHLAAPNGETGDLNRTHVISSKSGLIGVLVPTVCFYVQPADVEPIPSTWTAIALSNNLSCVIDPATSTVWKVDENTQRLPPTGLGARFVQDLTASPAKEGNVLSGIEYVHVEREAAQAEVMKNLAAFPDMRSLSIEEARLQPETVDAIRSLPRINMFWLSYVEIDADTLKALSRLENVDRLVLRRSDLQKVPQVDDLLNQIRKSVPKTTVQVVEPYDD